VKRRRKGRCVCVPDKGRSTARVRTFAEGDHVKNGLPAAYNEWIGMMKGLKNSSVR